MLKKFSFFLKYKNALIEAIKLLAELSELRKSPSNIHKIKKKKKKNHD